jgi:hypothetical protein
MPYVYRRKFELVDLFLDKVLSRKVLVKDGASSSGVYVLVVNGVQFREEDPDGGADSSAAIALALAAQINASTTRVKATAVGPEILLVPYQPNLDFSVQVSTSDPEGALVVSDAFPEAYQVKYAANWDEPFALLDTVPYTGKTSASVRSEDVYFNQDQYVRFRFAPGDYLIPDNDLMFLRMAPVYGGVPADDGRIVIVMTPEQMTETQPGLVLSGAAPIAADVSGSVELVLPTQTTSFYAQNTSEVDTVWIALGRNASEIPLAPGDDFVLARAGVSSVRVRTDAAAGAAVDVYMIASLAVGNLL